ncbi:MAG: PQQ-binding-like beta-propeller repeat protein [Tepidisphaerales bacterium]
MGTTPLLEGDRVVVNVGAEGGPSVVAFDARSGRQLWQAGTRYGQSYAAPVAADLHGRHRVLVFAGGESWPPTGGLMCIDAADGKVDFEFDWRGRRRESVNASAPLVLGNRVFISECYGRGSALVEIDRDFSPKIVWQTEDFGTHFMTAVASDGFLYGCHGHGPRGCPLVCLDVATGKEQWRHDPQWTEEAEVDGQKSRLRMELNRSQLLLADGRALCLTENGHLLWLALDPRGYKELSRAWLFAAPETWSGPVLSRGLLYVCQNSRDALTGREPRLICYDLRLPGVGKGG